MLGELPGGRLPFFCIYSTLVILWGSIGPWLAEHLLFAIDWTPGSGQASFKDDLEDEHVIQQKPVSTMLRALVQTLGHKSSSQCEGRGHVRMALA